MKLHLHNNPSGWAFVLSLEKPKLQLCYYLAGLDSCPGASTSINVVPSTSKEADRPLDAARTLPSLFLRRLKDLSYPLYHMFRFPSGNGHFGTTVS